MANYFKSKSVYNAGKRIKFIDDEGHATIVNNPEKSTWYMKNNTGAGITQHPTGLSAQMLEIIAKVKDNISRGVDSLSGISESGGRVVLVSTANSSTNTTLSANPKVAANEPVVIAANPQAQNMGFLAKILRWLFGF